VSNVVVQTVSNVVVQADYNYPIKLDHVKMKKRQKARISRRTSDSRTSDKGGQVYSELFYG